MFGRISVGSIYVYYGGRRGRKGQGRSDKGKVTREKGKVGRSIIVGSVNVDYVGRIFSQYYYSYRNVAGL